MKLGLRRTLDQILPGQSLTLAERDAAYRGPYLLRFFSSAEYHPYGSGDSGYVHLHRIPLVGEDMIVTGQRDPDVELSNDPAIFSNAESLADRLNSPMVADRVHFVEACARLLKVVAVASVVGSVMLSTHDS